MALTIGTAPFGREPAGSFNFRIDRPAHALYFEDSPRRVRVVFAGETLVDTVQAKLLHETGLTFLREKRYTTVFRQRERVPFAGTQPT